MAVSLIGVPEIIEKTKAIFSTENYEVGLQVP